MAILAGWCVVAAWFGLLGARWLHRITGLDQPVLLDALVADGLDDPLDLVLRDVDWDAELASIVTS